MTLYETALGINDRVNSYAWGVFGLILLLGTGFICTVATGAFQVTHFKHWISKTFGSINGDGRIINDDGALSQYRTFCMALCAVIGTGNIVGVSTAISVGGPGAVLWMWVAAFIGMMVKYSENVLGMYYRRRNTEGAWSGGPMYYLEDGLGSIRHLKYTGKVLGIAFCIFALLASFGVGNMAQINKIVINVEEAFRSGADYGQIPETLKSNWIIGIFLMVVAAIIISGGFRRLAYVSEKLIPFMSILYISGCVVMIILHIRMLPDIMYSIFRFALGPAAIKGGAAGTAVQIALNTVKSGCKRGVFSNEAGLGSSAMVHCNTCSREPVRQGMWGIAEVFLDTMVICTMTALVVLGSGAVDLNTGLMKEGINDATLVTRAFGTSFGRAGEWFLVICITLFAFTTVIGWSYYGTKVTEYLLGVVWGQVYRVIFIILIVFGAIMESNLAWDISDTFNGLMMIPNLIGLIVQIPMIVKLTKNYTDRRIRGMRVKPMLSFDPDIQREKEEEVRRGAD